MTYKLFSTDLDMPEDQYRAIKPYLLAYMYNERDDALGKACEINARGGIAWEIVSSEGTVVHRREIAQIICDRAADLAYRPKVR